MPPAIPQSEAVRYNEDMKTRLLVLFIFLAGCAACAPVLSSRTMEQSSRVVPLAHMQERPELYRGKSYVFGGTIASTKATVAGSLLELVFTSVDSRGALQDTISGARALAFLPKEQGFLDPEIFIKGEKVTVSGLFDGIQNGKIEEMQYAFPFFIISEIYLWPKETPRPYYDYYYPYPWWGPSWGFGIGGRWR